mmetsp:Transcript_19933/g.26909  ORF Transcript_19933/g.26909 Transcript_19933/m.26909 type:complete len:141 (+) Transcript_19933:751-1173(+)
MLGMIASDGGDVSEFLTPASESQQLFYMMDHFTAAGIANEIPDGQGKTNYTPNSRIDIHLSDRRNEYERSRYTLFALISDIGGFQGFLIILPSYFMAFWAAHMLRRSLASQTPVKEPTPEGEPQSERILANAESAEGLTL